MIEARTVLLVGCSRMGGALAHGWGRSRAEPLGVLRAEATRLGGTPFAALGRFDDSGTPDALVGSAGSAAAKRSHELAG